MFNDKFHTKMKKNLFIFTCLLGACMLLSVSCSEEKLSSESVIITDSQSPTPLDQWLERNYVARIIFNLNIDMKTSSRICTTIPCLPNTKWLLSWPIL